MCYCMWKNTYKQQKTAFFVVKKTVKWPAHRESNPELSLRRAPLYPFNYENKYSICRI